jgi:hypothetical protein
MREVRRPSGSDDDASRFNRAAHLAASGRARTDRDVGELSSGHANRQSLRMDGDVSHGTPDHSAANLTRERPGPQGDTE